METTFKSVHTKKPGKSVNLIWVGIGFSVIFWLLESVQDVLTFGRGDIFERIFLPDTMSLWTRVLVVCILMLFSVYAQSLRVRLEEVREEKPLPVRTLGVIASGVAFGGLYWILESFRDWFIYGKASLFREILYPDIMSFWMRLLAVLVIVLFSIYVQNLVNARKQVEESLKETRDRLEKLVNERTTELMKSNTLLQKQVSERFKIEEALRKANRALKILSQCNEAVVRAADEAALLDDVCRSIVRTGELDVAWVGFFSRDDGNTRVHPVSRAVRFEKYHGIADDMARTCDFETCPMAGDILAGKTVLIRDILSYESTTAWYAVLSVSGFESMVSLPLSNPSGVFGVLTILSQDGARFGEEEVALLEDLAEDLAYGITALRTRIERTRSEEEKARIQSQLLHSQKLEAVGVLAGGVAHDFNNLLTAIQVSTDLAMMQIEESEPVYLELKEIQRVAAHAGSLAKQLLLFSRKHPMEFRSLNLNQSIETLNKMLLRIIGEEIAVETRLENDLWTVWADRGTIEQVLMNLVVNAKDAMPNGGRLTVSTENVRIGKSDPDQDPGRKAGKYVRLTIADTGIGMDEETQAHIFEPFYSTKGPRKGSGLGLSVVYGIVQEHDGWVEVESRLGNGARFDIYLPAVFVKSEDMSPESVDYGRLRGNGERVLVIEDEVRVREYTARGLKQNNYQVYSVSTAKEAIALFDLEKGNFDLVFSDVVLPDQSGLELAEILLSRKPGLRIILSSGYADPKSRLHVVKERGMRFLQKPYALPELLRVLKS